MMSTMPEPVAHTASATLDHLLEHEDGRLLIRGATVISMDPEIGDLATGDLLIEGRRIAAVGPDLGDAAADGQALVMDAEGMIAIPGLHDAHRHSWQTQMRRLLPDVGVFEYVDLLHARLAPVYRPEDMYLGNYLAALTALQSGITCVLDFCHNRRTPEHCDEAVRAWAESGIRTTFVPTAPLFGAWDGEWREDIHRLQNERFASDDQLLRLRVGTHTRSVPELLVGDLALHPELVQFAQERGLGITVDGAFGDGSSSHIEQLAGDGLLDADMTFIHCTGLSTAAWDGLAAAGCKVVLAVTSDIQLGIGDALPPIQQALDRGITPGLSIDVECCLSSDLWTQMRVALNLQRMQAHQRRHQGDATAPTPIPVREALRYATIAGAAANGVADVSGSLTPGKAADIVLIRSDEVENLPLNNAVATVVLGSDVHNVDTVLVDGRPRKWRRELVGCDVAAVRTKVIESRDRLLAEIGHDLDVLA